MTSEKHYHSLINHIFRLLDGVASHKDKIADDIQRDISKEFYLDALENLEALKNRLEIKQQEFNKAKASFHDEYETLRKAWKKDLTKLKRSLPTHARELSN